MCMAESLFAHETSLWFCLSSDRIRAKLFTPNEIIYIGFLSPGFSGCPNQIVRAVVPWDRRAESVRIRARVTVENTRSRLSGSEWIEVANLARSNYCFSPRAAGAAYVLFLMRKKYRDTRARQGLAGRSENPNGEFTVLPPLSFNRSPISVCGPVAEQEHGIGPRGAIPFLFTAALS
jgi:hypothetical protein